MSDDAPRLKYASLSYLERRIKTHLPLSTLHRFHTSIYQLSGTCQTILCSLKLIDIKLLKML